MKSNKNTTIPLLGIVDQKIFMDNCMGPKTIVHRGALHLQSYLLPYENNLRKATRYRAG